MADAGVVTNEVADKLENVADVTRKMEVDKRIFVGFGVGVGVGCAVGYYFGIRASTKKVRQEIDLKYAVKLDQTLEEIKKHYAEKHAEAMRFYREKGDVIEPKAKPTPEEVVEAQGYSRVSEEAVPDGQAEENPSEVSPRDVERVKQELFERAHPEIEPWDYPTEYRRRRNTGSPFVIHVDEYKDNVKEHDQATWTYYEDDDVLATEHDEVVAADKWPTVIGTDSLQRFGHGSNDINVVYVRNEQLSLDVEIIRNPGNYAEIVHGLSKGDLRHSEERGRRRRPRFDDDQ